MTNLDPRTLAQHQARFFDDLVDDEWEITRPHGAPAFHQDVLRLKLGLATQSLGDLRGKRVLVVCGGSGMDAEFLARLGASVLTTDVSAGAVERARERSRRQRIPFDADIANVLALPFDDRSFDIVFVHDGLHHLVDPLAGLSEMARVADEFVSVSEPSTALATTIAIKLRLADSVEEAGNAVERLGLPAAVQRLEREGFEIVTARRYALFYRHVPGRPSRLLSSKPLRSRANTVLVCVATHSSRLGNKLAVVARRP